MWTKRKLIPATLLVAAASALSINQAQALGNDEAAILVGVAVGGLTTYALQHANDHHRHNDGYYERRDYREYREPPRRHCPPKRVEHYVIHNPPQYREREYERVSYRDDRGQHRGWDNRRGGNGYEYEYEYRRRGEF